MMLVALLVVLGVDLLVIAGLVTAMVLRRRWLSRHEAFKCRMRVVEGAVEGARRKWKSGRARWVGDVLVFSPSPLLFGSWLMPVTGASDEPHWATGKEGKGLGEGSVVGRLVIEGGAVALAAPLRSNLAPPTTAVGGQ